jgi:transposase-like protein
MKLTSHGLPRLTKERIIREYLSGAKTARMLSEEYGMSRNAINHMVSRHQDNYLPNFEVKPILPAMKSKTKSPDQNDKLLQENQELRRQLQLAKLKLEGYEIMGDILEEQYGIDLLKKAGAKQYRVSKKDIQK